MKAIVSASLALCAWATALGAGFSGGTGTQADPYLISSVADLAELDDATNSNLTAGRYYRLTADIAGPVTRMVGTEADFEGNFDGAGHCITVSINETVSNYAGLFASALGATICNLQVDGSVVGKTYVGGIIGAAGDGGHYYNLANYASVTATSSFGCGGVIGFLATHTVATTVEQCANFGTITAKSVSGGVLGYSGQGKGNNISRIANYGTINSDSTGYRNGGLVGNPLHNEKFNYCLNMGTASNTNVSGCFGVDNPEQVSELYYDCQYLDSRYPFELRMKRTAELTGTAMRSTEAGSEWGDDYWLYAEGMLPRLKMNGMELDERAVLYATPVVLADDNTLRAINKPFTACTLNGVTWSSANGCVEIDATGKARPVKVGQDQLTATLGSHSRTLSICVTGTSGIAATTVGSATIASAPGAAIVSVSAPSAHLLITNLAGQVVMRSTLATGSHTIALAPGTYIVRAASQAAKLVIK